MSFMRELIIAGDMGPCGGVNMALKVTTEVLDLVEGRESVFANHDPVHNDPILEEYKSRGLVIEPDVTKVPEGGIYIFSAHGAPPSVVETARQNGLLTVNVECQFVNRARKRATEAISKGEHVVYFGAENHPEPIAVQQDLPADGITFININSDERTPLPHHKPIRVLSQTTLSTRRILERKEQLEEEMGRELPPIIGICTATDVRQKAVREGIFGDPESRPERLVVVGSKGSHNSHELTKIGIEHLGEGNAVQIDSASQLDEAWFSDVQRVGLTSGASVLDRFTEPVIEWFRKRGFTIKKLVGVERDLTFPGPDLTELKAHLQNKYGTTIAS